MTPTSDSHSLDNASIDFDFYRRAAARERQQAMRRTINRCASAIGDGFALVVARSKRLFALRGSRPLRIHTHLNAQTFINRLSH